MKRAIKLKIKNDNALLLTIQTFNQACQLFLSLGLKYKTFNKNKLQKLGYRKVRETYPKLQSSLVQCARDCAHDMLKREKLKCLPKKKLNSAIRYNARTFTPFIKSGKISLSTIEGRKKFDIRTPSYYEKYLDGEVKACTLSYKNGNFFVHLIVELPTPKKPKPKIFLGVDRGIINHAVLSNNKFFKSNHIRKVKANYQHLRQKLQAIGTQSAKRLLRKISGRERRFMANANHIIANWILSFDYDTVVLEKLKGIRKKWRGKNLNRKLGNWAFFQLQKFLEYKAENLGKNVLNVPPDYTSRACSRCGCIDKANRKNKNFRCKNCGFSLNADLNAARNISMLGKSLYRRLPVNQPNVTCDEVKCFLKKATETEHSYKPLTLVSGS